MIVKKKNSIQGISLGYLYPPQLRFLTPGFHLVIIFYLSVFSNGFLDYIINYWFSIYNIILLIINIGVLTYNSGFEFDESKYKYNKFFSIWWMKFDSWKQMPDFEYFSITLEYKYYDLKRGYSEKYNVRSKIPHIHLYGVLNNRPTLMYKTYDFQNCLAVALFFRDCGVDIPIYDMFGEEPVEI